MAQQKKLKVSELESSIAAGEAQQVDIDALQVDILIICKNPAAFQQSASFLSRRGWPTTVIGNLSKAIDFIVKNSPDFVLISCNHPNPGTARLPSLLTTAMKAQVIAFIEQSDPQSVAKLTNSNFKNKLQGQPSGPKIQRMVRRLLMETFGQKTENEEESISLLGSDENLNAPSKPKRGPRDVLNEEETEEIRQRTKAGPLAAKSERKRLKDLQPATTPEHPSDKPVDYTEAIGKNALMELANQSAAKGESGMIFLPTKGDEPVGEEDIAYTHDEQDRPEDLRNKSERAEQKNPDFLQKGRSSEPTGLTYTEKTRAKDQSSFAHQEGEKAPDLFAQQQGPQSERSFSAHQENAKSRDHRAVQEGPESNEFSALQEAFAKELSIANPNLNAVSTEALSDGEDPLEREIGGVSPSNASRLRSQPASLDVGAREDSSSLRKMAVQGQAPRALESTSAMEREVERALKETCSEMVSDPKELSWLNMVVVLPIDSVDLHGYLVIGMAKVSVEKQLDFAWTLRLNLRRLLKEAGLKFQLDEALVVKLESFDFSGWIREEATWAYESQHLGSQMGVAFISTPERLTQPRESERREMFLIGVNDVDSENPISFKAYLHFDQSDRMCLYLRNGRRLSPMQKERLSVRNITDFYIKAVDINNYKAYMAGNFIRLTIKNFRLRRTG